MEKKLSEEILLIYDAAIDPERWPVFLSSFARRFPACGVAFWMEDPLRKDVHMAFTTGIDPRFDESYALHYAATNIWTDVMLRKPPGHVNVDCHLATMENLYDSEFYNDWLKPQGFRRGFGLNVANTEHHKVFFSAVLEHKADITDEDVRLMCHLFPHLNRAVQIHREIVSAREQQSLLTSALDTNHLGYMIVDHNRRPLFASTRLEEMARRDDGLRLNKTGSLELADPTASRRLDASIARALSLHAQENLEDNGAVAAPKRSGGQPYVIYCVPLRLDTGKTLFSLAGLGPRAAVVVSDPDNVVRAPKELWRQIFNLTPAEARFASVFLLDPSLKNAADACEIRESTARQYLKSIFEKTGAANQASLVKLLLSHAAQPRNSE